MNVLIWSLDADSATFVKCSVPFVPLYVNNVCLGIADQPAINIGTYIGPMTARGPHKYCSLFL